MKTFWTIAEMFVGAGITAWASPYTVLAIRDDHIGWAMVFGMYVLLGASIVLDAARRLP